MSCMDDIRADDLIWIFGTGRSGSTWLASMMAELAGGWWWDEPLVGRLFGDFRADILPRTGGREAFIMAEANREAWLAGIRSFVLNVAKAVRPEGSEGNYVIVKEPNGSVGAPLLVEATPESRVVLLVRDPRDVVASALDGHREGGHAYERASRDPRRMEALARNPPENRPGAFVKRQANRYLKNVGNAKNAYKAHQGYKALLRYEELRADPVRTMERFYSTLHIPVSERELARTVERHTWENVPEEEKGQGKFHRKATTGGWREDLTPRQVAIVEEITAPLLQEFYPSS